MGIVVTIQKSSKMFRQKKTGRDFYKNNVVAVIGIGKETQYNKQSGKPYPTFNFKTEKNLLKFIFDRWGPGRYIVLGSYKTFFVFWKGEINKDGWKFESQDYMKRELKWIEKEIENADDNEDMWFWEEQKSIEKEELKKKRKRYGFHPYLKSSGRRGVFHTWDEPELNISKPKKNYKKKKLEEMSIQELNDF